MEKPMILDGMDLRDDALFSACEMPVEQGWIDSNNHVNVAYYVVAFDIATDAFLNRIGMDDHNRETRRTSTFTAEMNVSYVREIVLGDSVSITTQLIGFDGKKIHYYHRMYQKGGDYLAATNECLSLHVNMETRRVTPFRQETLDLLAEMKAEQVHLARPGNLGRVFGART